ncbi:MAG: 1,4-alpha-glucan branching protein GlgB [Polyangiaceae bacterium]|nr:1,4-alpha-glucan branching protein GlgB [Polyangiaceae bacterium]
MLKEELQRIARGLHPDPHTVLGAQEADGGFVVRCLRPGATGVRVEWKPGDFRDATRVIDGMFEARGADRPVGYHIQATYPDRVERLRDAYSFLPTIGDVDLHLFGEGKHLRIHEVLGAHPREHDGIHGTSFGLWAPNALAVRVAGDFNGWSGEATSMRRLSGGVWELFLPGIGEGALYKFEIVTRQGTIQKSDPFGRAMELRPQTASRVTTSRYAFGDAAWITAREKRDMRKLPLNIYEVHLGSWRLADRMRTDEERRDWLSYRELAHQLVDYVAEQGFSHIELLPIMEHPYDGSWGYQVSGYFAPTARHGSPDDLKYFVDRCHQKGIGVLLDWVPAHFPRDASALGRFDGTPLFEHWDPRRGEHRQWETFVFDWGRPEVKNFLLASALYWLKEFHIDGLRVDAVASMLYLDYGASHQGEWEPNVHGGRENLEAVAFVRELCDTVHREVPGAIVCAEESTAWPGVTRPTYTGGLGFDFKWNMGWMHDTLHYFSLDPIFRSFNHNLITFSLMYAFSEKYLLPLSHDEVVHLKKSLLEKMPGDEWQKRANLRALYALMWAHPGKKLLFMGGELGQKTEWNFSSELDWSLLDDERHRGLQRTVRDLNAYYKKTPALFELDDDPSGFLWIDANDAGQSCASFIRFPKSELKSRRTGKHVIMAGNFTPVIRRGYRLGVPRNCAYKEVLNTDASAYGGSNVGNLGSVRVEAIPSHGHAQSISITLPPLAVVYLEPVDEGLPTEAEIAEERARPKQDS